jgi:hypothetical protein
MREIPAQDLKMIHRRNDNEFDGSVFWQSRRREG